MPLLGLPTFQVPENTVNWLADNFRPCRRWYNYCSGIVRSKYWQKLMPTVVPVLCAIVSLTTWLPCTWECSHWVADNFRPCLWWYNYCPGTVLSKYWQKLMPAVVPVLCAIVSLTTGLPCINSCTHSYRKVCEYLLYFQGIMLELFNIQSFMDSYKCYNG